GTLLLMPRLCRATYSYMSYTGNPVQAGVDFQQGLTRKACCVNWRLYGAGSMGGGFRSRPTPGDRGHRHVRCVAGRYHFRLERRVCRARPRPKTAYTPASDFLLSLRSKPGVNLRGV